MKERKAKRELNNWISKTNCGFISGVFCVGRMARIKEKKTSPYSLNCARAQVGKIEHFCDISMYIDWGNVHDTLCEGTDFLIAFYTKEKGKTDEDLFTNTASIYLQYNDYILTNVNIFIRPDVHKINLAKLYKNRTMPTRKWACLRSPSYINICMLLVTFQAINVSNAICFWARASDRQSGEPRWLYGELPAKL
jgi:hypothetical protein